MNITRHRVPFWAFGLTSLVLFVVITYVYALFLTPVDGIGFRMNQGMCVVTTLQSGGSAESAGIEPGDIILKVDNRPLQGNELPDIIKSYKAGDTVLYEVSRGDIRKEFIITLKSLWSQNAFFYFAYYILILIVSITSLIIIYKRPFDQTAKLFFIYIQLFAMAQNLRFLSPDHYYAIFASILFIFSFNLVGVVLLHFHLLFPRPVPSFKKFTGFLNTLYLIGGTIALILAMLFIQRNVAGSEQAVEVFDDFSRLSISWMAITLTMALIVVIYQFYSARYISAQRQQRLVLIGSVFGLLTPILYGIFYEFINRLEREMYLPNALEWTNGIGTYIMTTFLAFAIFKYRFWNVEIFVRKTIFYGLATFTIILTYFTLLNVIDNLLEFTSGSVHLVLLGISIFIFLLFRDLIQRSIDRLFDKEKYDPAKVTVRFEKHLAGLYEPAELAAEIMLFLKDIFHFKTFLFAIHSHNRHHSIAQVWGVDIDDIPDEIEITEEMESLVRQSEIFSMEEISRYPSWQEKVRGELLVPLVTEGKPFGFFVLGPKSSEYSYSLQDISLLSHLGNRVINLFEVAAMYRKDLDHQLLLERERTRIAKDFHDDVGASLTRISILSEMINTNLPDQQIVRKYLQNIADSCREVTQDMAQIIWALSPKHDNLEGLIAFIRRYTKEFLDPAGISCQFLLPEAANVARLGAEIRRNIYLCIKEGLNNIVKHSRANEVLVAVALENSNMLISLKDNGHGFDTDKIGEPGNGLLNIQKRMKAVGGSAAISSIMGQGTEIILNIPFPGHTILAGKIH